jgi:peptide/nickel transport system substrate-binding protein
MPLHRSVVTIAVVGALLGGSLVALSAPASGAVAAKPRRGGTVTFGLEAETETGFCLPDSTLAASGIQVVSAIYDTLVTLNSKGQYVPYLAKSVVPNADDTQWTITLRPGVKFQNGEPLDSAALKLNLDTYRGKNPKISALLNTFVFLNIADVKVSGPLSVVVTTKVPWPAFPAFLFLSGRAGIVAPAQLANRDTCMNHPIGTGPFAFDKWVVNDSLTVKRNPNYWRKGLPYLDKIIFRPVPEAQVRENGLVGGQLDAIQTSGALQIIDLRKLKRSGEFNELDSSRGAEVSYGMLNVSKLPFSDPIARQAVAYAGDAKTLNDIRNRGLNTLATGPFSPGSIAYLQKSSFPGHNLKKARALEKEYERKHGQPISFEYLTQNDPELTDLAALVQRFNAKAGITMTITSVDQQQLITRARAGNFQEVGFRNHPGGDPDTQYVWWHSGSPANFSRINDPVIDKLLDEGRVETDPAKRAAIYTALSNRFGKELYNLWVWYTIWAVATAKNVHGVTGPPLPDGHGQPFALFAGVIPVVGLYRSK